MYQIIRIKSPVSESAGATRHCKLGKSCCKLSPAHPCSLYSVCISWKFRALLLQHLHTSSIEMVNQHDMVIHGIVLYQARQKYWAPLLQISNCLSGPPRVHRCWTLGCTKSFPPHQRSSLHLSTSAPEAAWFPKSRCFWVLASTNDALVFYGQNVDRKLHKVLLYRVRTS